MNLEKQGMIKRMINYAVVILIVHLLANEVFQKIIPINVMQLLQTNYIIIIAFSYLLIKLTFIKGNKEKKEMLPYFIVEVILLGLTIDKIFMIVNILFLIILKGKELKQEEIIEKNIKEYYKNHEK